LSYGGSQVLDTDIESQKFEKVVETQKHQNSRGDIESQKSDQLVESQKSQNSEKSVESLMIENPVEKSPSSETLGPENSETSQLNETKRYKSAKSEFSKLKPSGARRRLFERTRKYMIPLCVFERTRKYMIPLCVFEELRMRYKTLNSSLTCLSLSCLGSSGLFVF
jgi:hypothetical protein